MYKVECHARCSYSFVDGKCTDFNLACKRACKGGLECRNDGCEFYRKYNFRNYSQFDHCGDKVTCRECLESVFKVPCLATKYVTFDDDDELQVVVVRYKGEHSCTAIEPVEVSQF